MSGAVLDRATVAIGAEAAILRQITADNTHLALWRRPRSASLAWIDMLQFDTIDDLDFAVAVDLLEVEVAEGLAEAGYPQNELGVELRNEVVSLAARFAGLVECDRVKIRLEVVETNACWKFHADTVIARLLTTLSGPGTQWIETAAPEHIHQLAAGDVAIFKGRLWAAEPLILHRSPPIAGTGDRRLLLVINPFGPGEAVDHG